MVPAGGWGGHVIPMQVHLCSAGPQARLAPTVIRRTVQLRKKFLQEVKPPIRGCVCVCVYARARARTRVYVRTYRSWGRNLFILYNRPQGSVFSGVSRNEFQDEKVTNFIMGRTMKFFTFYTTLKPADPLVIWVMLMHCWF